MTKAEYNAVVAELDMIHSTMKLHADGIRTLMARAIELTAQLKDVNVRGPRQTKNHVTTAEEPFELPQ